MSLLMWYTNMDKIIGMKSLLRCGKLDKNK